MKSKERILFFFLYGGCCFLASIPDLPRFVSGVWLDWCQSRDLGIGLSFSVFFETSHGLSIYGPVAEQLLQDVISPSLATCLNLSASFRSYSVVQISQGLLGSLLYFYISFHSLIASHPCLFFFFALYFRDSSFKFFGSPFTLSSSASIFIGSSHSLPRVTPSLLVFLFFLLVLPPSFPFYLTLQTLTNGLPLSWPPFDRLFPSIQAIPEREREEGKEIPFLKEFLEFPLDVGSFSPHACTPQG